MATLALQRCLHHGDREAIGRCLECGSYFCRECITEHDERILCAACLAKISRRPEKKTPRFRLAALRPWAAAFSGIIVAWWCFYLIGRLLVAIPADFHADSLWNGKIFESAEE